MNQKVSVAVGDIIQVRLGLLHGMLPEDPSSEDLSRIRVARHDPSVMDELLKEARKAQKNDNLTVANLSEQHWLYPRRREARVMYVERMGGGQVVEKSGAPGAMKPSAIGSINVEVKTVGSTVMQPAIGHYPIWAQETFRLENLAFYNEEPDDDGSQTQHVAYPTPEPDGKGKGK